MDYSAAKETVDQTEDLIWEQLVDQDGMDEVFVV